MLFDSSGMGRSKKKLEDKSEERDLATGSNSPLTEEEYRSEIQNEDSHRDVRRKKSNLKRKGKKVTSPRSKLLLQES